MRLRVAGNNYTFSSHQKLQIQEKAAQEVKLAIKPFYQNKDITKEEYKEIVRKAVDKVSVAAAWTVLTTSAVITLKCS